MANPSTPGGAGGQINVGSRDIIHGLEKAGTPTGSMALTILVTDTEITFEVERADADANTGVTGTGKLADLVPLELFVTLYDGTIAVAGRWASSLEGDANTTANWYPIPATGDIIDCYDIFAQNGTIYIRVEAALSGTGRLGYKLRCGRDS